MTATIPPPAAGQTPGARLNGWKEIASYFGRGVRTVQRWEKIFGMPVHRMGAGRGENVHAFVVELDTWLRTAERANDLSDTSGERDSADAGATPGSGARSSDAVAPAPASPAAADRPQPRWAARHRMPLTALLIGAAAIALLLVTNWPRSPRPQPENYQVDFDTLRVFDVNKNLVFSHKFETGLPRYPYYAERFGSGVRVLIEDIDGDGAREVLVFAPVDKREWPSQLICFDAAGNVRFTRRPDQTIRFGSRSFGPPWMGQWLFTTETRGIRRLWVAWVHIESGEFPSLLERLSPDLTTQSEYWSAGYVSSVNTAVVKGVPSIVVGAANNDHQATSLAVFPEDQVKGCAPAEHPEKACDASVSGGPSAFVVFPRLEFAAAIGHLPGVTEVRQQLNGELRVWITQGGADAKGQPISGQVYYDLSPDLTPLRAGFGPEYVASHRRAEGTAAVSHPFGDIDRAQLWPVLIARGKTFVPVSAATDR